jgi:hypothetical protein
MQSSAMTPNDHRLLHQISAEAILYLVATVEDRLDDERLDALLDVAAMLVHASGNKVIVTHAPEDLSRN